MDSSHKSLNEPSHSASWWTDQEEHREQGDLLREQLQEMDEHVARLQDMLRCERTKGNSLQLRCNQLEFELKRREQHNNRLKERLSQFTVRHKDRGGSIEVLNFPPGVKGGKREHPVKSFTFAPKREEAALRLMLERREAELREAMKLRHSLTTLLHTLRVNMEQTLSDAVDVETEVPHDDKWLSEAEAELGDHVTGGVVQSWRRIQVKLSEVLTQGHTGVDTDHDKLMAQLETDLRETQQLVRLQQQLLQGSIASPVPTELANSYFLEEWERLQMRWAELSHHRRTFERERQSFTDAAIRLSHEVINKEAEAAVTTAITEHWRLDFERQRATLVKQQYLCDSPKFGPAAPGSRIRRESSAPSLGPSSISGCLPITPSSTGWRSAALSASHEGQVRVQSPSTPDLYAALNLSYNCRASDVGHHSETCNSSADGTMGAPLAPHLDWSFE